MSRRIRLAYLDVGLWEDEVYDSGEQKLAQQVDALHEPAALGIGAREHVDEPPRRRAAKV